MEAAAQSEDEEGVCRKGRLGGESAASAAGGLGLRRFKVAALAVHAVDMRRVVMCCCGRLLAGGVQGAVHRRSSKTELRELPLIIVQKHSSDFQNV